MYPKLTCVELSFVDIFYFAEDEYKIDWNSANDLFFRSGALRYGGIHKIYPGELKTYVFTFDRILTSDIKLGDIPKDEVMKMDDVKKAKVILGAFFEKNEVDCPAFVDCS